MPALSVIAKSSQNPSKRGRYPRMLVLAPTRELAMQSQKVLEEFGQVVNLTSAVIYGGVPKPPQKDVLRKGVDCIVCTPGRLKDLINEGSCNLGEITHLVLDEADR
jgi:ATP-dependent RNA helicase DBP3